MDDILTCIALTQSKAESVDPYLPARTFSAGSGYVFIIILPSSDIYTWDQLYATMQGLKDYMVLHEQWVEGTWWVVNIDLQSYVAEGGFHRSPVVETEVLRV